MTMEELYQAIGGNYNAVKELFMSDTLIQKFALRFKSEGSYHTLMEAVKAGDIEASFAAAHTLKGVAGNIGFSRLQQAASDLTEQLRSKTQPPSPALVKKVQEAYENVMENLDKI